MRIKRKYIIILVIAGLVVWFIGGKMKKPASAQETVKIIHPQIDNIRNVITTTGTVLPKNRLEIKPPVNGRIEKVLVKEGQAVKAGDEVVIMSSTDRAALLDAARGQGEDKVEYWQDVYKPIPIVAPVDGEVIVGTIQPGQTVTTSDPIIVLSDQLIIRAQVDETDIGKVKEGQNAVISLDAYPDDKIDAHVDHIYHESKTSNNVTIYEVDLIPNKVPEFFRSGMSANVDFIQDSKENVLVIPVNTVQKEGGEIFVTVQVKGKKQIKRPVTLGLSDEKNVEVVSGLSESDEVVLKTKKYVRPQNTGTNPLMPAQRRR